MRVLLRPRGFQGDICRPFSLPREQKRAIAKQTLVSCWTVEVVAPRNMITISSVRNSQLLLIPHLVVLSLISRDLIITIPRSAGSRVAQRGQEGLLVSALLMEVGNDARSLAATKVLRAGQPTARLMVVAGDASSLDALRALRGGRTSALPMAAVGDVDTTWVAPKQPVASQVSAFVMVVASGVLSRGVHEVRRAKLGCASHMEVGGGANSQTVPKGLREAPCTAKPMGEESGVCLRAALKALKGVPPCARGMEGASDAFLRAAGSALRVCTVEQIIVWPMEVGSAVRYQDALKAQGEGQTVV